MQCFFARAALSFPRRLRHFARGWLLRPFVNHPMPTCSRPLLAAAASRRPGRAVRGAHPRPPAPVAWWRRVRWWHLLLLWRCCSRSSACLASTHCGPARSTSATWATCRSAPSSTTWMATPTAGSIMAPTASACRFNQVSSSFIQALVAREDSRFYSHHGVDPRGILRAIVRNITRHRAAEGASTLTQQLARNSLPLGRQDAQPQNSRSVCRPAHRAALYQGPDPRILRQPHLLRRPACTGWKRPARRISANPARSSTFPSPP